MNANLIVCASGEGTNFEAIVRASQDGHLAARVTGLVTNRPGIGALRRAHKLGIPFAVLNPKNFASRFDWDRAMVSQFQEWKADYVVLAGYLALIGPEVLKAFAQRVVNSHPALLPKFGGEGMYGDHVHAAVVKAGEKESGVTIHLIDEVFDRGKILAQERVVVLPNDTAETLSRRVKDLEVLLYPKVINDMVTGRLKI
jgi:phosphoribosylglycinamide formyltransferase-1